MYRMALVKVGAGPNVKDGSHTDLRNSSGCLLSAGKKIEISRLLGRTQTVGLGDSNSPFHRYITIKFCSRTILAEQIQLADKKKSNHEHSR